jgi:O-antigen/teichoic acid export membrane protein
MPVPNGTEPADRSEGEAHGGLPRDELKRRVSAGISIVATRGLAILVVGFAGNVVIARLLTPHDFGVIAIGMSVVLFTSMLADGGLGAALIRRVQPPAAEEYEALMGLQLTVTVALTLVVAAIGAMFGKVGLVTAVMVSSMPLVALQFPGRIDFERSLSYRPLAIVEIAQVVSYQASAIALVLAGLGVWGLAIATVLMRAVAAVVMCSVSPLGLIRPRFSWHRIRPLIGFGLSFQAASATWLVRDQGLNASIAAIGSVATLGLWTLARRLMEVPLLLFQSLSRVSFPTMSQLVAANEDPAPLLERAASMAVIGSGLVLVAFAGSAPGLIPGVFGEQWRGATDAVPGACLGLAIGGSITVATQGYLYAVGDASAVLWSSIWQTVVWFAVTLPLFPVFGIAAIGLGWFISALVEAALLIRATRKWTDTHLVGPLIAPLLAGSVSAGLGWTISELDGRNLLSGVIGGSTSVACFLIILLVLQTTRLRETFRFVLGSVRAGASRGEPAGTVPERGEAPGPATVIR